MKVTVFAFGRSKFSFVDEGVEHYLEQIGHLAEPDLVLLRDQGSNPRQEGELLLEAFAKRKFLENGKTRVFLLDEAGKEYSSRQFATTLAGLRDQGVQRFVFALGGAYGFSDALRAKFTLLSLSKLTFPHDLARLVLLEQIYRALQIWKGGKYHHD